jgi:hypothetical protein
MAVNFVVVVVEETEEKRTIAVRQKKQNAEQAKNPA